MKLRPIVLAAALVLVAAACGADDPPTVAEPAATEPAATEAADQTGAEGTVDESAAATGPGDVPDLDMINVHTDEAVNLQAVVDGSTPLLFWFWAPH